jgi:hypothetical protein
VDKVVERRASGAVPSGLAQGWNPGTAHELTADIDAKCRVRNCLRLSVVAA